MHFRSESPILYFGTPVVLLTTINEDGSPNIAPISSAFWLGWRCMLGMGALSKTSVNLQRTGQIVINMPSTAQADAVDRLALTTGSNPVPELKIRRGYRHEHDKFGIAELTPVPSETVDAPRILECPVQMEGVLADIHALSAEDPAMKGHILSFEIRITRVWLEGSILKEGNPDRVNPDQWRPLIMSFQQFYGLGERVRPSTLSQVPEQAYRSPDIDKARAASLSNAAN